MTLEVWCDGSVINGGPSAKLFYGIVSNYKGYKERRGGYIGEYKYGEGNSVLSEYKAVLEGIKFSKKYKEGSAIIYTDCEPVFHMINGENPPDKKYLRMVYEEVQEEMEDNIEIYSIPRSENKAADKTCEEFKKNYRNKDRLENARGKEYEFEKVGKSKFLVNGKYEVDTNHEKCSCSRKQKTKCEHLFYVEIYFGKTELHPN